MIYKIDKDIQFNIIQQFKDVDPSIAIIENKYYTIEVYYIRDFESDKQSGFLNYNNISLNCKHKDTKNKHMPLPALGSGMKIALNMQNINSIISESEAEKLIEYINIAKASAVEIIITIDQLLRL